MSLSVHSESLLDLDPDLGVKIVPERLAAARRELRVRACAVPRGLWTPTRRRPAPPPAIGVLVVSGALVREVSIHDAPSAELLGPGDIIRAWREQEPPPALDPPARWSALTELVVASLDAELGSRLGQYPEVMAMLIDRMEARARRLAVTQAISQMTGVDLRLLALFKHLAERWGRVTPDGIVIPLDLSHQLLGSLVGARRPTVSTALASLAEQRRLARRPNGSWLLLDPPPGGQDLQRDDELSMTGPITLESMLT